MSRPRALFVCHRLPFPPDKGDKIRSWRLLGLLRERYDVALGAFVDDEADWKHERVLRAACADLLLLPLRPKVKLARAARSLPGGSLTASVYRDPRLSAWIAGQRGAGPAVEVAFSSAVAPSLFGGQAPLLLDMVDVDSAKWSAYAETERWPVSVPYGIEGRRLARLEADATRRATATFLVTPEEADLARALPGAAPDRIDWWANGVDTDVFRPGAVPPARGACDVVMTGAMDYRPNADAAVRLARDVLPLLRDARPGTTLALVGARPVRRVERLADLPGVTVTGRVPDIRPWLLGAKVAAAPLTVARGVQNKVLEAMAAGLPIVASAGAAAGSGAEQGKHLLVADGPRETAEAILRILSDQGLAAELGTASRALAERDFGWEARLQRFARYLP